MTLLRLITKCADALISVLKWKLVEDIAACTALIWDENVLTICIDFIKARISTNCIMLLEE